MEQTPDPARVAELENEIIALYKQVRAAEAELEQEQFKGVPRYERDTVVLVPRKLFGKVKAWPARIERVYFDHRSGTSRTGEDWEFKTVSYAVTLRQKDGSFGGSTESFYHKEVVPLPAGEQAP